MLVFLLFLPQIIKYGRAYFVEFIFLNNSRVETLKRLFASKASSSSWIGVRREVHRHKFRIISSSLLSELPFCECRRWGSFKAAHDKFDTRMSSIKSSGPQRCRLILQQCLAIQLSKAGNAPEDFWMYDSGYMIFQVRQFNQKLPLFLLHTRSTIQHRVTVTVATNEKLKSTQCIQIILNYHWIWTMTLQSYWFFSNEAKLDFIRVREVHIEVHTKCIANERE